MVGLLGLVELYAQGREPRPDLAPVLVGGLGRGPSVFHPARCWSECETGPISEIGPV